MEKEYLDFQEFQSVAKSILKEFKHFCEQNDLRFFLSFGTLLGAVRHNNFIPWDYDIDVVMPRKDFDRFLELTKEDNINEYYKVFSWKNTSDYYIPFVKICDARTRIVVTQTTSKIPLGIWIDVFPLDGLPEKENKIEKMRRKFLDLCYEAILPCSIMNNKEKVANVFKLIDVKVKKQAGVIEKIQSLLKETDYESAEFLCVGDGASISKRWWIKKVLFDEVENLPFGDELYPCPKNYDEVLKIFYGDYMQLPPEEDRKIPTIKSYYI